MSELVLLKKDIIRLNFLKEINDKTVSLKLFLEVDGKEKDINEIKQTGQTEYRFNNFNVIENSADNKITFNHNVIGCLLYFKINTTSKLSIDILKKDTNAVANTIEILPGETKITFNPNANKQYDITVEQLSNVQNNTDTIQSALDTGVKPVNPEEFTPLPGFDTLNILNVNKQKKSHITRPGASVSNANMDNSTVANNKANVSNSENNAVVQNAQPAQISSLQQQVSTLQGEVGDITEQITKLQNQIKQLENNKKNLKNHLDKLQAEYDKNYKEFEVEAKKMAESYHIDAEILEMYKDRDVVPVEELLKKANDDNSALENQIKVFIAAQERKIADIEKDIKG